MPRFGLISEARIAEQKTSSYSFLEEEEARRIQKSRVKKQKLLCMLRHMPGFFSHFQRDPSKCRARSIAPAHLESQQSPDATPVNANNLLCIEVDGGEVSHRSPCILHDLAFHLHPQNTSSDKKQ